MKEAMLCHEHRDDTSIETQHRYYGCMRLGGRYLFMGMHRDASRSASQRSETLSPAGSRRSVSASLSHRATGSSPMTTGSSPMSSGYWESGRQPLLSRVGQQGCIGPDCHRQSNAALHTKKLARFVVRAGDIADRRAGYKCRIPTSTRHGRPRRPGQDLCPPVSGAG